MNRAPYPTDLTEATWRSVAPHLPAASARSRPRVHPIREILDAILYGVRSGGAYRDVESAIALAVRVGDPRHSRYLGLVRNHEQQILIDCHLAI